MNTIKRLFIGAFIGALISIGIIFVAGFIDLVDCFCDANVDVLFGSGSMRHSISGSSAWTLILVGAITGAIIGAIVGFAEDKRESDANNLKMCKQNHKDALELMSKLQNKNTQMERSINHNVSFTSDYKIVENDSRIVLTECSKAIEKASKIKNV